MVIIHKSFEDDSERRRLMRGAGRGRESRQGEAQEMGRGGSREKDMKGGRSEFRVNWYNFY